MHRRGSDVWKKRHVVERGKFGRELGLVGENVEAGLANRPIEPGKQSVERIGGKQRLLEILNSVGVRNHVAGPSPQNRIQLIRSFTRNSV